MEDVMAREKCYVTDGGERPGDTALIRLSILTGR
jgi:hypothetical protein